MSTFSNTFFIPIFFILLLQLVTNCCGCCCCDCCCCCCNQQQTMNINGTTIPMGGGCGCGGGDSTSALLAALLGSRRRRAANIQQVENVQLLAPTNGCDCKESAGRMRRNEKPVVFEQGLEPQNLNPRFIAVVPSSQKSAKNNLR